MSWGDYLHKAQVEESVCVFFFFGLSMLLCVSPDPTARYSLFVLKLPLNTNKPNQTIRVIEIDSTSDIGNSRKYNTSV